MYLRDVERLPHSKDTPQTHFLLDHSRTAPIAPILDTLKIVEAHRRLPSITVARDGHKGRFFARLVRVRLEWIYSIVPGHDERGRLEKAIRNRLYWTVDC